MTIGCFGEWGLCLGGAGLQSPPAALAASPEGGVSPSPAAHTLLQVSLGDCGHRGSCVLYDVNTQWAFFPRG